MSDLSYPDEFLASILRATRSIAVVGLSANPARPSHSVCRYLAGEGYTVCGVNPGLAGQQVAGVPVFASLADVPGPVDMVDVFRNSDAVLSVAAEVMSEQQRLGIKTVWMQLDVVHRQAERALQEVGIDVVMDRCPAIERPRLQRAAML